MILIAGGTGGLRALLIGMGGVIGTTNPKENYDFDQFLYFASSEFQFLKGYLGLGGQLVIFHNASSHSMGDDYPYGGNSYLKPGDATPQWPNGYPYFSQKITHKAEK